MVEEADMLVAEEAEPVTGDAMLDEAELMYDEAVMYEEAEPGMPEEAELPPYEDAEVG